jgi:hypothetical protein
MSSVLVCTRWCVPARKIETQVVQPMASHSTDCITSPSGLGSSEAELGESSGGQVDLSR